MKQLALAAFTFLALTVHADTIDNLVRAEMEKGKIPGVGVAVIRDSKTVKLRGYGLANLEHTVPVKPETVFQSGSVGKQFTATLAMIMVEEGKIKLTDHITKYLPEGKDKWGGVTIKHLLTHTSGMPDMPYNRMDMRKDYSEDDLVKFLLEQEMVETPGQRWRYNNGGYVMLGILLGRVGGKFYGDLLRDRVFEPLGMKTARIITESEIVPNRSAGYVLQNGKHVNHGWVAPKLNTTADGSLYLTLHDYVKWDQALYGDKLLKPESLRQMWTPVKLNDGKTAVAMGSGYGFGWAMQQQNGIELIHHGGAWQGFTAWIGRVPEKKTTVVVLGNLAGGRTDQLGMQILHSILPEMKPKTAGGG
jgi:CubicO group peptidase (beta-lactamase class C family)